MWIIDTKTRGRSRSARRAPIWLWLVLLALAAPPVAISGQAGPGVSGEHSPPDKLLSARLQAALVAKGPNYKPRTEHLDAEGRPQFINRLILEDSPYLLQHAHNPVNWFAWGEEAFASARAENKPVFLSIGYSTCHWCHVMERESFENLAIARVLNEHFVAIKVDRERRPDVDAIYMSGVTMMTGRGGWPMSSFLTPEGKPFYGGTYYPPDQFARLLERVGQLWTEQQPALRQQAEVVSAAIQQNMATQRMTTEIARDAVAAGARSLMGSYDRQFGGFGTAPKFPNEPSLLLLLRHIQRTGDVAGFEALTHTLDAMARGGIYDQIGGGFHRYSTDRQWQVPHFEKMLYNQAQLSRVYGRAWSLSGEPDHRRVVTETLDYVLREMRAPGGAFYSATDADSDGREGVFFVWTPAEVDDALGSEAAALAKAFYGMSAGGNFEDANILHRPSSLADFALARGIDRDHLRDAVDSWRGMLRTRRQSRPPPLRDDKILSAWNGLMISALTEASVNFGQAPYLDAALRAADYLHEHHWRPPNHLLRVSLDGRSSIEGGLEDYAYLGEALLALYDATTDAKWLNWARLLADTLLSEFHDAAGGAFFMNRANPANPLFLRPKQGHDDALPSGNSAAVSLLSGLWLRTGEPRYLDAANAAAAAFSEGFSRAPAAFGSLALAADTLINGQLERVQYAARGAVRVSLRGEKAGAGQAITVELRIADRWHINSDRPRHKDLVPTRLAGPGSKWRLVEVNYPDPVLKRLDLREDALSLFEGRSSIRGRLLPAGEATENTPPPALELQLQACNDEICLPPELLQLPLAPF